VLYSPASNKPLATGIEPTTVKKWIGPGSRRIRKLELTPDAAKVAYQPGMSLAFQSVAPGDYFEFTPDGILDVDHRVHLEYKGWEH
jgi:hypothetical protein